MECFPCEEMPGAKEALQTWGPYPLPILTAGGMGLSQASLSHLIMTSFVVPPELFAP